MLDRLIEHISGLPENELVEVTLQDMAICGAWCHCVKGDPGASAQREAVSRALDSWTRHATVGEMATEGRRHQWLLRELIDELEAGNTQSLTWDELDMLLTALDLARKVSQPQVFKWVIVILERHADRMASRHQQLSVEPRLPGLSSRLHVVTEEDIARAQPREITMLAGINIRGRGPVLNHRSGHLKVLGSVPENCTLVIEDGSCDVEGFVIGKVAASQHCEVRENISGVVVVEQGDVRARNIIFRAYVVSKWGGVYCRKADAPDLVFGGSGIQVEQSAIMGRYAAPVICVKGEVHGGQFTVSRQMTADRLRSSKSRELAIALRTELSCQDYGEVPGPEASRLLAQAAGLRRRIAALQTRIDYTRREAEQAARNAIFYMTGSEQARPLAEQLGHAQHRLAQVNRIRTALQTLIEMSEERVEQLARLRGGTLEVDAAQADEAALPLEEISSDFVQLEVEGGVGKDIGEELSDVVGLQERLLAPNTNVRKAAVVLNAIRERRTKWDRESVELRAGIAKHEFELREGFREKDVLDGRPGALPTVNLLKQVLATVRNRSKNIDDPVARRLQAGFMQVSMRIVNSRADRLNELTITLDELSEQLSGIAKTLRNEFQIAVSAGEGPAVAPSVMGRFEAGVKIYADAHLLDHPDPPRGAMIETVSRRDEPRTYFRRMGKVVAAS